MEHQLVINMAYLTNRLDFEKRKASRNIKLDETNRYKELKTDILTYSSVVGLAIILSIVFIAIVCIIL